MAERARNARTLERRLFGWMLGLALAPTLALLALALWLGSATLGWVGTFGAWDQLAESGSALFNAAAPAAADDTEIATAIDAHREALTTSLVQAQRWTYIGGRIASALPLAFVTVALLLSLLALAASRMLARDIAQPIEAVTDWAARLARGEPLPPEAPSERREVREARTLRAALREAADRIEMARIRALEAERVRAWGELARRVAHEMKNPLTPLRLAGHRLSRAAAEAPALQEPVEVIQQETRRLEELAREFAALGRPGSGSRSEVDLDELLRGLLASDVPDQIHAVLSVQPGAGLVHADYDALLRALRNMLRNAVESVAAAGVPGRIDASVDYDDKWIIIRLSDNGVGFTDADSERIFEPDYTRKPGGTGLGLAIARQAVMAHGGELRARPGVAGGAEFVITLPRTTPAPA
jgi:two-component system, NtrC family, nitrogen regulation sensor histidine kinase NtrY